MHRYERKLLGIMTSRMLMSRNLDFLIDPAGVPQGSVLGLSFFLVAINELVDYVHCDVRMFVDDA